MNLPELSRDANLLDFSSGGWLSTNLCDRPVIIFIHGFGSSKTVFGHLARYAENFSLPGYPGFRAVLFDYNTALGIEEASRLLTELLTTDEMLVPAIGKHGLAIVGHSMGGLVARYFDAFRLDSDLRNQIGLRSIVTLGTPHFGGGPPGKAWRLVFKNYETLSGEVLPFQYASALNDLLDMSVGGVIARINSSNTGTPIHSISGGQNRLTFSSVSLTIAVNAIIQGMMNGATNDGIVVEESADCTRQEYTEQRTHTNNYQAYPTTNHNTLYTTQVVAQKTLAKLSKYWANPSPAL